MAHRILSDEEFLSTALGLFRAYGFEGVSLKQLADATGLEKASLYYRYPGGKNEIVMAVASDVVRWFEENVFAPLSGPGSTRRRVVAVAERLRGFYVGGTKPCVMDVLSIPGATEELKAGLKSAMQAWIKAYAGVAIESGMPVALARARAEEAIVRFEGALIVGRVLSDTAVVERVLKALPEFLTVA